MVWMQSDKNSSAWVLASPKGDLFFNARQFPVVEWTYFGVKQQYLEGLVGQTISKKAEGGRQGRQTKCDAYGENLVKVTMAHYQDQTERTTKRLTPS
jgi:hypothetical protein